MTHKLIVTQDGSSSIENTKLNTSFHSTYGALKESLHTYIQNGLRQVQMPKKEPIKIFEMGFGTGLNTWLTLIYNQNSL